MRFIVFLGDSLDRLRDFPKEPRHEAGYQLERVQRGFDPNDWKPMTSVGPGVREIRVRYSDGAYRVLYAAAFRDAICVLHAFAKKTRKTPARDIEIAVRRFRQMKQGTAS